jgi:hypothetical protein
MYGFYHPYKNIKCKTILYQNLCSQDDNVLGYNAV